MTNKGKYYILKLSSLLILLVLLFPFREYASSTGQDTLQVTGIISGGRNKPLSGVSLSIEGVNAIPVISDSAGRFQLYSPSGHEWIIITSTGEYKSKKIYLNNKVKLNIQLTPKDVVSGYDEILDLFQTKLRRNVMSSFETPDEENLNLYPYQSIDQSFQGNIPGMFSVGHSGMPGSGTVTYLRGLKSLYTNNQPLYVVDGIPIETPGIFNSEISGYSYNPLSSIEPLDITNMTILKDFTGGSIFGMKGSNGVVLIETMKPNEVQTRIDLIIRTGMTLEPNQLPQLNNLQYKTLAKEVLASSYLQEEVYKEKYPGLYLTQDDKEYYQYNNNTNWQDEVFRNALLTDIYLKVRGGDEIARYGLSVGYLMHQGIIENTKYDRANIRFVGTFNIFQWLRMYISTNLNSSNSDLKESAKIRETSPILTSLFKSPLLGPYKFDEQGIQLKILDDIESLGISNPSAVIKSFEASNTNYRFLTSFRIEGDIMNNLKWNSVIGLNFNSLNESVFMPDHGMELYYDGEAYNVTKSLKNYLFSFYNDNYLIYNLTINNIHTFSITGGIRLNTNTFETDWGITKNSHQSDEYKQLQSGISYLREMGGDNSKWNRLAFYGNINYSFRDKYILYTNITTETSTRIGSNAENVLWIGDVPFGMFYCFGAAWRISGEPYFKDIPMLEDLKFRLSYGVAGNDDIGNYQAFNYYKTTFYRETSGMVPGTLTEEKLTFENLRQWSTGMDISLFGDKLSLSIDLFNIKTRNLLVYIPQSTYIGFNEIPMNNGTLINKGWEFDIYTRIVSLNKFKWDVSFNLAGIKNQIIDIYNGELITQFEGGEFISRTEDKLLNFYGYVADGVYATTEEASEANLINEKNIPFGAGDVKYADLSGPDGIPDGIINKFDKTIIGSPIPDFYGGFTNSFKLGRWSLNAQFQFVSGNEVFNYLRYQNEKMTDLSNQSTAVLNRWVHEGQVTEIPRAAWGDPVGNNSFSTRWIENGSYLRLKNLTVAYTIPDKMLFFRNVQIFATATNLITLNNYLGYDPEFSYSFNTLEQGIDYGLMPYTKKFIFGIKIGL
jgi:TonB-linked SusC/RagA family outer membrane protein